MMMIIATIMITIASLTRTLKMNEHAVMTSWFFSLRIPADAVI